MDELIKQEIKMRGPLTFHDFMQMSLYHPTYGYYSQNKTRRGKKGDYFTSAQVSPLFAEIFAEAFIELRKSIGSYQCSIIEMGSGGGEFLESVMEYIKRKDSIKGWKVWAVETSRASRDQIWRRISRFPKSEVVASLDDIDWVGSLEGIIFSNEFFDALPFHRLKFIDGKFLEIFVDMKGDAFVETAGPLSRPDLLLKAGINGKPLNPEGWVESQEIEVRPDLPSVYEKFDGALGRGYVVTVDYGHPRSQLYSPRRPQGTWTCFHQHKSIQDPYKYIGDADITAHVDFTQLLEAGQAHDFDPLFFSSQGLFLSHVGQKPIEERIKEKAAIQQLIHPDAMGESFWVLAQGKGIEWPASYKEIPNRLSRLTK